MSDVPVITIDGPGGVGKGTLSRLLAARLGWHLLDSGMIYRAMGLAAARAGLLQAQPLDEAALIALARDLPLHFAEQDGETHAFLDSEDVTQEIRSAEAGQRASQLAVIPELRRALLQRQRDFRRPPGLVADGRDMGTVVFADAPLKVFITASVEERSKRRLKQLLEQGASATLAQVEMEIAERDRRDRERSVAPLVPAPEARILDNSGQTIEQTYRVLEGWARDTLGEFFCCQ
ncbi:(d)CMP kinase [Acidithiobacillus sp. AMEEHan]|uniref:(d)CMP kinase n=1 Tax=Acidithiobacillus sp. AMEEHan TaxID=2994951 RepID=UPI0027E3EDF1|nr:(d)CMP kinase [Acidithiobacillus sp. AMEEHan]